jgi:hypothetical protein
MSYPELILFLLAAAAVSMLLLLFWRHYWHRRRFPELERQQSLLSPQQHTLYQQLTKLVGAYSVVLPRVNLSELVMSPGARRSYEDHWKRVRREWVDFVVCSPSSISPVLAVKLETRAAERKRRKSGGLDVLEDTLTSAKVPLLRLNSSESYDANEIMTNIRFALVNQKRKKDEELFVTEEFLNSSPGEHLERDSMSEFKRRTFGLVSNLKAFGRAT